MNLYENIIFDFDGVIAESTEIKNKAFFKLYEPYGLDIAERVLSHHTKNGGMSRFEKFPYYHKKYLNKSLSKKDISTLSQNFSSLVVDEVVKAKEVKGVTRFLEKYKNKYKYWIISATPQEEIIKIVKKRKISKYFQDVLGSPINKIENTKKVVKTNKLKSNKTVFIGDAINDYEAACSCGVDFILRETNENKSLFINIKNIQRIKDLIQLDELFQNFQ